MNISGATSSTLTVSNIDYFDEGDYYCEITYSSSKLGNGSEQSKSAYLNVNAYYSEPTISSQPRSSSVRKGGSATFSVGLNNTTGWNISYEWYRASNTYSTGTYVGSGGTLKLSNCAYSDEAYYYCLINYNDNVGNTGFLSSSRAYLTVTSGSSGPVLAILLESAAPSVGCTGIVTIRLWWRLVFSGTI